MSTSVAKFLCASFLLTGCLASRADAQGLSVSFGQRSKHGSFSLTLGSSCARPSYVECRPSVWVPGHFESRCERVWVPGCTRQVWVAPRYEWRNDACGRPVRVCVRTGYWTAVTDPGRYETRTTQVWIAGRWRTA
jgi:hypothetical protein